MQRDCCVMVSSCSLQIVQERSCADRAACLSKEGACRGTGMASGLTTAPEHLVYIAAIQQYSRLHRTMISPHARYPIHLI